MPRGKCPESPAPAGYHALIGNASREAPLRQPLPPATILKTNAAPAGRDTKSDVEALLAAPDEALPTGLRGRATLELMYVCGLRISELVTMRLDLARLDMGAARILRKGGRERIVPFNLAAALSPRAIFGFIP